ncbi:hypothetical protein [Maribacter sp. 2308TA10-17]|uniref:hypothetical protein n=1 Tax=Maribacter sp. 2308TA10-17 TaxID=3386276 RepID=UPI0039BCE3FA
MKRNSPLKKLSDLYTKARIYEYEIPTGKDGFLATNSLLAYFGIFTMLFGKLTGVDSLKKNARDFLKEVKSFSKKIDSTYTLFVLYSGSSKCVAMDIESKCIEASLCDLTTADYRNFGHGRHNWFDKRPENSAIILLTNNVDRALSKKTIEVLPNDIPYLTIDSDKQIPLSSVDQLLQSFHLIEALGKNANIDPGRPGVPEFGRKLYNLNYYSIFKEKPLVSNRAYYSIHRKIGASNTENHKLLKNWNENYEAFIKRINNERFTALIFDFDGTLCSSSKRYDGVDDTIKKELLTILQKGFIIGVSTGRGKSARENLQSFIPEKFYNNVFISYYNGFETGTLGQNELPDLKRKSNDSIVDSHKILKSKLKNYDVTLELRPGQLTVEIDDMDNPVKLKSYIRGTILKHSELKVQILESDHSIDIIPKDVSKLSIVDFCKNREKELGLEGNYLCVGDKGIWPGNDYKLLSTEFSLSVDEVSLDEESCWNLASVGLSNVEATNEYLGKISFYDNHMKFRITK